MATAKRRKHPIADHDGADRLCDLPQPIIHHILSLLPPTDVVKTCLLSKTLQSALYSFPVIDLDMSWSNEDPNWTDVFWFDEDDLQKNLAFISYLNNRVQRFILHKAPLQKFRLRAKITDRKQADSMRKAIKLAMNNGVQQFDLDLVNGRYSLPLNIIRSASSVVTLRLSGLKMSNLSGFDMSCCCPLLENLTISHCNGLRNFEFSSSRIRSIALKNCDGLKGVKIRSPSLQDFRCANIFDPFGIDISECRFLKVLSLSCVCLEDNWVEDNVLKLIHLEDLEMISSCNKIIRKGVVVCSETLKKLALLRIAGSIEIRAPKLESLTLETGRLDSTYTVNIHPCMYLQHLSWKEYRSKINLDALKEPVSNIVGFDSLELKFNSCLTRFDMNRSKRSEGSFSDIEKMIDVNIDLLTDSGGRLGNPCSVTIWNWIASFSRVRAFTISGFSIQELAYSQIGTPGLLKPILDLKHLTIKLITGTSISPELVNTFLCISPNLETLHFASTVGIQGSMKFEYWSRTGRTDNLPCCRHLSIRCWRHSMRRVLLKNFNDTERHELTKYFQENGIDAGTYPTEDTDRETTLRREDRNRAPPKYLTDYVPK